MSEDQRDADIIFFGFAERAALAYDVDPSLIKWNALGIKSSLLTPFVPLSLVGWSLVLGIKGLRDAISFEIIFRNERKGDIGSVKISCNSQTKIAGSEKLQDKINNNLIDNITNIREEGPLLLDRGKGLWDLIFMPVVDAVPVVIFHEGRHFVECSVDGGPRKVIGAFNCIVGDVLPFANEELNAMRANPAAAKTVRGEIKCSACKGELKFYVSLDRNDRKFSGYTWHEDIEDKFICSCGKLDLDLRSTKKNFFYLLGNSFGKSDNISATPMYEASVLSAIATDFQKLVDLNPEEEKLQKFIEKNTIILSQFSPKKILFKPPILSKFNADFAVISAHKELILIEIEKPSTRILKKNGAQHAELTHAIEQVRMWLHAIEEFKHAVLDSMKVELGEISTIRGVVIAGRELGNDAAHLRRLKSQRDIQILTYDDLIAATALLSLNIRSM